ncbi:MAG: hypothetical protein QNJ72_13455 [Pleurocapsa sp. MO_226.B13]|nr:hypothetical protein [Pleurocapsa sp. MO_226.B13]
MDSNLTRSTIYGIAGVHESTDNTDTSTSIFGGNAAATNFIIDIEGETGLGLDFDTTKLANFINDITLPDQDIENARLATNLMLDAAGGIASSIPFFGGVAATGVAMQQTLSNYAFDLLQVEAQNKLLLMLSIILTIILRLGELLPKPTEIWLWSKISKLE